MTKKVMISVRGTQEFENQDDEVVELLSVGTLSSSGDGYTVSYEETELTGMEGVTTTFDVQKDQIVLRRTGAVVSTMIFQPGRQHESLYDMGFGALLMSVEATHVVSRLSDMGGEFELDYIIRIENQIAGVNSYVIKVREMDAGAECEQ